MSKPVIAFSHSALDSFHTCAKKHYHTRVAKDVKEDFGEAASWGQKVHKAFERYFRIGAEFPSNMEQYLPIAQRITGLAGKTSLTVHAELMLAVDQQLRICGWKDWNNCWGRAALDILLMAPFNEDAIAFDLKTGKRKMNDQQLVIQAVFVFLHYPHINKVTSGFIWLKEGGAVDKLVFTREQLPRLLKSFMPKVRALTDAVTHGEWPANPSGLCREYCPVSTCKHNGMYRK